MSLRGRVAHSAPTVELVFDPDCPNVDEARELLRAALAATDVRAAWREWRRDAAETPPALRGLGSPTILVDGTDVSGPEGDAGAVGRANCCRVYLDGGRFRGVPPLAVLTAALTGRGAEP